MDWRRYWEEIKRVYDGLDRRKRLLIGGSALGTILILVLFISLSTRTHYAALFTGLDPADAGAVVEALKADGVNYKLDNGGATILVPREKVYDLRLKLAAQGIPQTGTIGYEIFDQNNIGSTDFVQKINYHRALEGELARTISTLNEVKAARVHLVIPEKRLFERDQKEATASVTLKLKPGHRLTSTQVQSIANLVASSVEGLRPENVTIIDTKGNILSRPRDVNSAVALSDNQMELKKKVEQYYTDRLTQLLENVVGKGKVAVQVAAELNFDRVERTVEKYDPDNMVVISQEQEVQENPDSGASAGGRSQHTITNYEANKTIEKIVQDVGNVKRLTVAVMVDGKYLAPPNGGKGAEPKYVPRSETELEQLREAVKTAIGFSEQRGDEVQVVNLPFDRTQLEQEERALQQMERRLFWERMLKRLAYLLLILGLGFGLYKVVTSFKTILVPHMQPVLSLEPGGEAMTLELPPDIKNNVRLQQTIATLTREKPDDAAKLLKAWLVEEVNE